MRLRALPLFSGKKSNKVVPINPQSSQARIVVLKPKCFNNSTAVADELRKRRPVIVDVGALDPDEARRVVDFISGTVYGIDGKARRLQAVSLLLHRARLILWARLSRTLPAPSGAYFKEYSRDKGIAPCYCGTMPFSRYTRRYLQCRVMMTSF